jgi:hypothetical protein
MAGLSAYLLPEMSEGQTQAPQLLAESRRLAAKRTLILILTAKNQADSQTAVLNGPLESLQRSCPVRLNRGAKRVRPLCVAPAAIDILARTYCNANFVT